MGTQLFVPLTNAVARFATVAAATLTLACLPLRESPPPSTSDGSAPATDGRPGYDAAAVPPSPDGRFVEPDARATDAATLTPSTPDLGAMSSPDAAAPPPDAAPPVVHDAGSTNPLAPGSFTLFSLFGAARDIALGTDGNLYFSHYPFKIGKVTPAAEVLQGVFTVPNVDPYRLVPTSDGAIWAAGEFDEAIVRLGPDGSVRTFPINVSDSGPDSLTLGPDGNLWFTEAGTSNWIGRMTPTGQVTRFDLNRDQPSSITTGPDGNLWATIYTGSIARITPTGQLTKYQLPGNQERGLMDIVRGPDNNLWFTQRSVMKLGRITPTGTITEIPLPRPGATGEPWLDGIITGPDGNLWYAGGEEPPVIGRVTPTGVITEFPAPSTTEPERLTFDRNGAIWFTSDRDLGRFIPPK